MRTAFDFSPLYRSSIGFDRVFDLLENASRTPSVDNLPPSDIARTARMPIASPWRWRGSPSMNSALSTNHTSVCSRETHLGHFLVRQGLPEMYKKLGRDMA